MRSALGALLLFLLAFVPVTSFSAESDPMPSNSTDTKAAQPPAEAVAAVEGLLTLTEGNDATFDAAAVAPLLDYIIAGAGDGLELPAHEGASGAMIRDSVDSSLERIIQYAYNPNVPAYLAYPSVIRVSGWEPGSDILSHPALWTEMDTLTEPLVLRGREFEEITPDTSSGGYYRYVLDRTLVLMKYQGRNVLLSIARQDGLSEIGKKGVVIDDASWEYFYSDIDGLTKGGIGWMDTYLYGSWSVSAYVEEPGGARTTNVVFKWLRAGWAKMNVVRPKHILAGCRRFADAFRTVIGSDKLPPAEDIAAKVREITSMPDQEMERKINEYALAFQRAYGSHPELSGSDFSSLLDNGAYAKTLDRAERIGVLLLEYLKNRLGTLSLVRG